MGPIACVAGVAVGQLAHDSLQAEAARRLLAMHPVLAGGCMASTLLYRLCVCELYLSLSIDSICSGYVLGQCRSPLPHVAP